MKSASRPIFLLTSSNLNSNGIGSLFIHSLIEDSSEFNVEDFSLPPYGLSASFWGEGKISAFCKSLFVRLGVLQALRLFLFRAIHLLRVVRLVEKKISVSKASVVWVTASSPEVIWVAEQLGRRGYDMRVMVWDDPEYLLANLRLGWFSRKLIYKPFDRLIADASKVSVIGLAMRERFSTRYGVDSLVIRHGIAHEIKRRGMSSEGDIKIVFAGSLYAKDEWNAFVAALESVSWKVSTRKIKLYFIGRFPLHGAKKPTKENFEELGEQSFNDTLNILESMDIGYLPYWFSRDKELVVRTSFPGKMSAYAAAGLTVFHHAPLYSDAAQFLNLHRFGVTCSSKENKLIIKCLEELLALGVTESSQIAREEAFRSELSQAAMYSRFKNFVG